MQCPQSSLFRASSPAFSLQQSQSGTDIVPRLPQAGRDFANVNSDRSARIQTERDLTMIRDSFSQLLDFVSVQVRGRAALRQQG